MSAPWEPLPGTLLLAKELPLGLLLLAHVPFLSPSQAHLPSIPHVLGLMSACQTHLQGHVTKCPAPSG